MRMAWYAGASTGLATGVVLSAFYQRANFYSAMVYLYQSNLCLMILVNLIALVYSSFVYSLQRICFGRLRAIEVEQLYERAWFAVTETCLAMTIFRDEVGGFFIVMFAALLTGKVWGWIGEGRIDSLEQQPPANPRLFHARLVVSLFLSLAYDGWLLYYAARTVVDQARPDMMVMFLFEFAVLLVTSLHTALRYSIALVDLQIIKKQTQERLQERRRQIREERAQILLRREAREHHGDDDDDGDDDGNGAGDAITDDETLPDEDDIDEMDIEVSGWEAKGQYILALDLWMDFTKLSIYAVFFFVLLSFYGLPLHIIRDLFMTVRSFIKRLGALMKYRQAIRDMNRYADATEEELARENTCIICREDMHVWGAGDAARIERTRPKKLPCGHILHLGCLKSWMERQQVCPTCRRSVAINDAAPQGHGDAVVFRAGPNMGGQAPNAGAGAGAGAGAAGADADVPLHQIFPPPNGQAPAPAAGHGADGNNNLNNQNQRPAPPPPPAANNGGAIRMFNFGPFRLGFAQGGPQDIQDMVRRLGAPAGAAADDAANNFAGGPPPAAAANAPVQEGVPAHLLPDGFNVLAGTPRPGGLLSAAATSASTSPESILNDLRAIERRIELGSLELQIANSEAHALRLLLLEMQRVRAHTHTHTGPPPMPAQVPLTPTPAVAIPLAGPARLPPPRPDQSSGQSSGPPQEGETPSTYAEQPLAQATQATQAPEAPQTSQTTQTAQTTQAAPQMQPAPSQAGPFGFPRVGQPPAGFASYGPRANPAVNPAAHFAPDRNAPAIPSGSAELPAGVQIPAGWSLLPLHRVDSSILGTSGANAGQTRPADASAAATSSAEPPASPDGTASGSGSASAAVPQPATVETVPDAAPEAPPHGGDTV